MKYVSIDLETTGPDNKKHPILEIGAVCDQIGEKDPLGRKTFRALIIPDDMDGIVVSPFTALMHKRLWEEMLDWKKNCGVYTSCAEGVHPRMILRRDMVARLFTEWLNNCGYPITKPITVGGKNAASFDIPFLKEQCSIQSHIDIRHRVLDVAPMFWRRGDECLPDLNTCLQRAGIEKRTTHGALDDALLVCDLVDKAFEVF